MLAGVCGCATVCLHVCVCVVVCPPHFAGLRFVELMMERVGMVQCLAPPNTSLPAGEPSSSSKRARMDLSPGSAAVRKEAFGPKPTPGSLTRYDVSMRTRMQNATKSIAEVERTINKRRLDVAKKQAKQQADAAAEAAKQEAKRQAEAAAAALPWAMLQEADDMGLLDVSEVTPHCLAPVSDICPTVLMFQGGELKDTAAQIDTAAALKDIPARTLIAKRFDMPVLMSDVGPPTCHRRRLSSLGLSGIPPTPAYQPHQSPSPAHSQASNQLLSQTQAASPTKQPASQPADQPASRATANDIHCTVILGLHRPAVPPASHAQSGLVHCVLFVLRR